MNGTAYRSPPGYPLFYLREDHHISCSGCGNSHTFSLLFVHERHGSVGSKARKSFSGETIYALPIHAQSVHITTARCERCLDTLPREPIPYLPPLRSPIGRSARMTAAAAALAAKRPKAVRSLDDFDFS